MTYKLVGRKIIGGQEVLVSSVPLSELSEDIPPLTSVVVDSIANANFKSLKYFISVLNDGNIESLELLVTNNNGVYVENRSNRVAGGFDFTITPVNNLGVLELTMSNNTANSSSVGLARLVLA